jgi:hypothetical protein
MNTQSQSPAQTTTKELILNNDGVKLKVVRKSSKHCIFNTQQCIQEEVLQKIQAMSELYLLKTFNEAHEEHVKQAIIEATLELGYYDLGIRLVESL